MVTTPLGRTGMIASRMGLGAGGHSRLGLSTGGSEENAITVVRTALDLGINFIDTAESYRTEKVIGKALVGVPRESVILSTKVGVSWDDSPVDEAGLGRRLDSCLARLQTDYVDIFHLHGVRIDSYARCRDEVLPWLIRLKEAGKIRAFGITEAFAPDPEHEMLGPAVAEANRSPSEPSSATVGNRPPPTASPAPWDVVMVGFNLLNQSARERVLVHTRAKGIGTLCMFAVRRALSRPEVFREVLTTLGVKLDVDGLAGEHGLQDMAYRYCLSEPGLDVILSGTGNPEHLKANAASINRGPLPAETKATLDAAFAGISHLSGN